VLHIAVKDLTATVELRDITGRTVRTVSASEAMNLDVTGLDNGIYFCTISGKDLHAVQKVMISK
jgi:hypothetical protein